MKPFFTSYSPQQNNIELSYGETSWDLNLEQLKNLKEVIDETLFNIEYYNKTKKALEEFHEGEEKYGAKNIHLLRHQLLEINPWDENDCPDEWRWYNEWVQQQIDDYHLGGHKHVLDLKSSGGILQSINLETGL